MKRDNIDWLVYEAQDITPKPSQFNKETPINELFAYALNEIAKIHIGESFLLRDLFKGYLWNRLTQSQKAELGRLISDYIDYEPIDFERERYLSYVGKTKQKQMIFQIVEDSEELNRVPRKTSVKDVPALSQWNGDPEAYDKAFFMAIAERRSKKTINPIDLR